MKYALIFDLDGTLWDARKSLLDSYNLTMKNNSLPYTFDLEKVTSFMGLTPIETSKLLFNDVSLEQGINYFNLMVKDEIKYLSSNPGTIYDNEIQVLDKLSKKFPLFIVSNCESGYIETYLNGCNTKKYFKDFLCIGMTKKEKFENIILMKEKHNIENIIYIGDTNKDYLESKKANVKFIHASYGFGKIEDKVPFIKSLDELDKEATKLFKL